MKDFYYILGVKETSQTDEIKKAYRKLSVKFHPDKNDGDDFFTERFKEIQEAYETLGEPKKRSLYDMSRNNNSFKEATNNNNQNFVPSIEYFYSSASAFKVGDEITFSWKTINANRITIRPFGQVQPIGQKTYRITNCETAKLTIELLAENTDASLHDWSSMALINNSFELKKNKPKTEAELAEERKREIEDEKYNEQIRRIVKPIIIVIALFTAFRLFQQLIK